MYCGKCGHEIEDECKFCPKCGNAIERNESVVSDTKKTKKSNKKRNIMLIIACLLILSAGGIGIYSMTAKGLKEPNNKEHGKTVEQEKVKQEKVVDIPQEIYLAAVQNEKGEYGYINEKGEEVIPCQYSSARNFNKNGVAIVGEETSVNDDEELEYGLINVKGEKISEYQYYYIDNFSKNGLAKVSRMIEEGGEIVIKYGYINEKGKEVIPCQYAFADDFSQDGLAPVSRMVEEEGKIIKKYGYINEKGKEIIPCQFADADIFTENGLAIVSEIVGVDETGEPIENYGYIDEKGEKVIECQFKVANRFNDMGFAEVGDDSEKTWYINEKGEKITNWKGILFEDVISIGNFSENEFARICRAVGVDEEGSPVYKYGYVDTDGKEIIPCQYDWVNPFGINFGKEYLADVWKVVGVDDEGEKIYKYTYINERGEEVIEWKDEISDTGVEHDCQEYFALALGEEVGIDDEGETIYKYKYFNEKGDMVLELPDEYTDGGSLMKVEVPESLKDEMSEVVDETYFDNMKKTAIGVEKNEDKLKVDMKIDHLFDFIKYDSGRIELLLSDGNIALKFIYMIEDGKASLEDTVYILTENGGQLSWNGVGWHEIACERREGNILRWKCSLPKGSFSIDDIKFIEASVFTSRNRLHTTTYELTNNQWNQLENKSIEQMDVAVPSGEGYHQYIEE